MTNDIDKLTALNREFVASPKVVGAMIEAATRMGTGAGGTRNIAGERSYALQPDWTFERQYLPSPSMRAHVQSLSCMVWSSIPAQI
jgi:hypothetical protein